MAERAALSYEHTAHADQWFLRILHVASGCACLYAIVLHSETFCTRPSSARGVPAVELVHENTTLLKVGHRDLGATDKSISHSVGWGTPGSKVASKGDGGIAWSEADRRPERGGEQSPFVGPDGLVILWLKVQAVTDLVVPAVTPLLAMTGVEVAWQARCVQYLGERHTCVISFIPCHPSCMLAAIASGRLPTPEMFLCLVQRPSCSPDGLLQAAAGPLAHQLGTATAVIAMGWTQGCRLGVEPANGATIPLSLSCGGFALCGLHRWVRLLSSRAS